MCLFVFSFFLYDEYLLESKIINGSMYRYIIINFLIIKNEFNVILLSDIYLCLF